MGNQLETIILRNLIQNENYARKVLPFIRKKYFSEDHRIIFSKLGEFVRDYGVLPDKSSMIVTLEGAEELTNEKFTKAAQLVEEVYKDSDLRSENWLLDTTQKWCKEQACNHAVLECIDILNGKDQKRSASAIPGIFRDALNVGFDTSVGHNYLADAEDRWERYHDKPDKIEFNLDVLNEITAGGYERKTLNMILAGIHVGKSLIKCAIAAKALMAGLNVLYVSLEMAEEKVAERIDANLMNIAIQELGDLEKEDYVERVNSIKKKTQANLFIKQFPTASAHVGHIRALLEELKIKQNWVPDVIMVDYIQIMASERVRNLSQGGTYTMVKAIAEELRGVAIEYNVAIWSSSQFTRAGMESSDQSMTQVAESIGLPATADLMLAVSQPDKFKIQDLYFVKQLKNRYHNLGHKEKFVIGVNKDKMQIYDVDDQPDLIGTTGEIVPQKETPDFDFEF